MCLDESEIYDEPRPLTPDEMKHKQAMGEIDYRNNKLGAWLAALLIAMILATITKIVHLNLSLL